MTSNGATVTEWRLFLDRRTGARATAWAMASDRAADARDAGRPKDEVEELRRAAQHAQREYHVAQRDRALADARVLASDEEGEAKVVLAYETGAFYVWAIYPDGRYSAEVHRKMATAIDAMANRSGASPLEVANAVASELFEDVRAAGDLLSVGAVRDCDCGGMEPLCECGGSGLYPVATPAGGAR